MAAIDAVEVNALIQAGEAAWRSLGRRGSAMAVDLGQQADAVAVGHFAEVGGRRHGATAASRLLHPRDGPAKEVIQQLCLDGLDVVGAATATELVHIILLLIENSLLDEEDGICQCVCIHFRGDGGGDKLRMLRVVLAQKSVPFLCQLIPISVLDHRQGMDMATTCLQDALSHFCTAIGMHFWQLPFPLQEHPHAYRCEWSAWRRSS